MLLDGVNPYLTRLPEVLSLVWADFEFELSTENEGAVDRQAEWTVMAYLAADCDDLAAPMFDDLLEMKSVGSDSSLHVCALFDGPLLTDAFFARLNKDTELRDDVVFRWPDLPTNDTRTLIMAQQVASAFPGKRRILFLGGHGNGWKGFALDRNIGRAYERTPARIRWPGPPEECFARLARCRGMAQERINRHINANAKPVRTGYDVLALDACYMGNIEAIAGLAQFADILVVSEDLMPGEGYPYDRVLRDLRANPSQSPLDLARGLVGAAQAYYQDPRKGDRRITQVALRSAELSGFAAAFVRLTQSLGAAMDDEEVFRAIRYAINTAHRLARTGNIDLKGFVQNLVGRRLPANIATHGVAVLEAWNRMVIAAAVPGTSETSNGLSIYAPAPHKFDVAYIESSNGFAHSLGIWSWFLASYYLRVLGDDAPEHPLIEAIGNTMAEQRKRGAYPPGPRGAACWARSLTQMSYTSPSP